MDVALPYELSLREYQQSFWDAVVHDNVRRSLVVWPRRNGKDLITLNILIAKMFQRVGLYFYVAPFQTQVRSIIWNGADGSGKKFLDYIPRELIKRKTEADMKIELINGSILRLIGSDNIDSIVGNNPIGIAMTEYSLHKREAWDYLRPVLAENGGFAIFNGTPRGLNHFYQMYESARRDDVWFTQYLTRDDTGIPSLEAIDEDRRSGMPESLIQQEYYVSWNASSEETLIPLDIIEPCLTTVLPQAAFEGAPRIMGVDVAYAAKGDKAVIAKRQGRFLHPLQKFQGLDNMSFASRIADEINQWQPSAVFIDAGRGEGVISRLEQLGFGTVVFPVHFGGRSFSDLYQNKKAEIWCRMRDWFIQTDTPPLIPSDEDLTRDLSAPSFEINERGFIQIETKKALKKRGYSSTDSGDAVALTFAEDVYEDPRELMLQEMEHVHGVTLNRNDQVSDQEYDMLNYLNNNDDQFANHYG